jgi:hypothetical protein
MANPTAKQDEVVVSSAARTADDNFTFVCNTTGGLFVIDVTAATATPSVVFTIQGVEPISGNVWTILQSAAITAAGTTVLRVYPTLTAAANTIAQDILPQGINIFCDHADADSITYSVRFIGSN